MSSSVFGVLLLVALSSGARVDVGYVELEGFGSYKLYNAVWRTWEEAYKVCVDDGAHLLVLNSQEEFNSVEAWLKPYAADLNNVFQYGTHHKTHNNVLRTVFDDTLEEAGYSTWATFAPDLGYYKNDKFPCVTINIVQERMYKGLSIANGVDKRPFICKKKL